MRKFVLSLLMCVPMAFMASGAPLSPEQALGRALQTSAAHSRGISSTALTLSATVNYADAPALYTFNRADNKGFLVVSADDASVALLGYCDEGSVPANPEDMPDGLRYWLDCLAEDIHVNAASAELGIISKDAPDYSDRTPIGPLVTTKWNQGEPYYNKCPQVNGRYCVTGCVATATAQVVAYHKYPVKGVGSHSYTWNNQTLSFDYESTEFDWDNMLDVYTDGNYTTEQADAVATLMYACGVGVNMGYGTGGSGANTAAVVDELVNYFGYPEGVRVFYRSYYTLENWNEVVYNQLQEFGPLQFSGRNTAAGHSFVCDGANGNYFHFNWGWAGMSDGYFLLTALNPGSQGIGGSASGYTQNQYFIGNVNPTAKKGPVIFQTSDGFKVTPTTGTTESTTFTISNLIYNNSGYTLSGGSCKLAVKLEPLAADKEPEYIIFGSIPELKNDYGFKNLGFTVGEDLEDGLYKVTPVFQTVENGEWHDVLIKIDQDYPYYTLKKEGTELTMTPPASASVTVDSFTLDSPIYLNQKFMATAVLTNATEQEYLNNICVLFCNSSGSPVAQSLADPLDLMPGESYTATFFSDLLPWNSSTTVTAGSYEMYLAKFDSNYQYTILSGPINVTIEATAPTPTLTVTEMNIPNNQPANKVNISGTVECTAGYFCGNLIVAVFLNGTKNIYQENTDPIIIGVPSSSQSAEMALSTTASFQMMADLSENMDAGDQAFAAVFYYDQGYHQLDYGAWFTVDTPVGIEGINADANAVIATDYYNVQGQRFDAKPTLPGIYILRETLTSGKVRTQRVMIH